MIEKKFNIASNHELLDLAGIGWLRADGIDVYKLVADAWLGNALFGFEIHHISNDGYDNRSENLIYSPVCVHRGISHRGTHKTYTPNPKFPWDK